MANYKIKINLINNCIKHNVLCRICLTTCSAKTNIFHTEYETVMLSELYRTCTSIQIEDDEASASASVNNSICGKCTYDLITTHLFIKKCQASHQKLLEMNAIRTKSDTTKSLEEPTPNGIRQGPQRPFVCNECGASFNHRITFDLHSLRHSHREAPRPVCAKKTTTVRKVLQQKSDLNHQFGSSQTWRLNRNNLDKDNKASSVSAVEKEQMIIKTELLNKSSDDLKHDDIETDPLSNDRLILPYDDGSKIVLNDSEDLNNHQTEGLPNSNEMDISTDELAVEESLSSNDDGDARLEESSIKEAESIEKNPDESRQQYQCTDCDESFTCSEHYMAHQRLIHIERNQWTCKICEDTFEYLYMVNKHFLTKHSITYQADFKLITCLRKKKFIQSKSDGDMTSPFAKCPVCSKVVCKASLKKHVMLHTGEKPNMCDVCGKAYVQRASLIEHMKKHTTRESEYICRYCSKGFISPGGLKYHLAIHEAVTRPFPCDVCEKVLRSAVTLHKHKLSHNKPFTCATCGKQFANKTHFDEHMNRHLGKLAYRCSTCWRGFYGKVAYTKHMHTYHNNIRHPCRMCDKVYKLRKDLIKHGRKVHSLDFRTRITLL